ncbi:DUF2535 family protein [Anaerobacillus sp. MEB173]|uniref:DUF2535 family protein n=1 Tax=Anaerobacillus sp. MEB173 TaxID=3383345 RepID=UPI003F93171E
MYQSIEFEHHNGTKIVIEDIPNIEYTPENKDYALSVIVSIEQLVDDINLVNNPSKKYSLKDYIYESGFSTARPRIFY